MTDYPLISIIIPVYNGSNYLREAIDSALSQTYKNIEVVVVNDGSTDNTEEIALSYGNRIKYFKKENGGVSSALNYGLNVMKGDYFSWLSHDDLYSSDKIEKQISLLLSNPNECFVSYCRSRQIDENGRVISKDVKNKYLKYGANDWEHSLVALIKSNCLNGCSFLIPKSAFEKCGYFDERLKYSQDLLMWINIFSHEYGIMYCDGSYVFSRVHSRQLTQTGHSLFFHDTLCISNSIKDNLIEISNSKYNYIYYYSKYCAKYNCSQAAKICVKSAAAKRKINFFQRLIVLFVLFYGKVRPFFRNLYYKFKTRK